MTTAPLPGLEPFHIGIVVKDLAASMDEMHSLLGLTWTKPLEGEFPVWTPEGRVRVSFAIVYSRNEGCKIELMRETPGTLWEVGQPVHHLGCWSDDLNADAGRLEQAGHPTVAAHRLDDGSLGMVSYHRGPNGLLVELVSRSLVFDTYQGMFASDH